VLFRHKKKKKKKKSVLAVILVISHLNIGFECSIFNYHRIKYFSIIDISLNNVYHTTNVNLLNDNNSNYNSNNNVEYSVDKSSSNIIDSDNCNNNGIVRVLTNND